MAAMTASRIGAIGAGVALVGGAGLAFTGVGRADQAAFALLTAFSFATSVAVGALLLSMLGYVTGAAWMAALRRLCDVLSMALLPCALLFVALVLSVEQLYPWARLPGQLEDEVRRALEHRRHFANLPFFTVRGVVYFGLWIVPALLLRRWSMRRDALPSPLQDQSLRRERMLSGAMLLPGVLAITFAAFDWLMALQPTWVSSAFGLYYLTGGALAAVALVTLLAVLATRAGAMRDVLTEDHLHALGRVLFAFTILWAYVAYFQVFLITIADAPREVTFYLARGRGSWRHLGWVLAAGHFAIPVLLLAPRSVKLRGGYLAGVSAWLLLMHYADLYYLTMPVLHPEGARFQLADLAALAAVLGACTACCAVLQRKLALVARHDPALPAALRYRSLR